MSPVDRTRRLRHGVILFAAVLMGVIVVTDPPELPMGGAQAWYLVACTLVVIVVADSRPAVIEDGRQSLPIGLTAGLALGMVTGLPGGQDQPLTGGLVIVVVAAGMVLAGWVRSRREGTGWRVSEIALRLAVVALATGLMRLPIDGRTFWGPGLDNSGWAVAFCLTVVAALSMATQLVVWSLERSLREHSRLRHVFVEELQTRGPLYLGVVCSAVMVAEATTVVGGIAVPVFVVPLVLLMLAIRGQAAIRAAQRQTVYALSRLTDQGGFTAPGHAARVAALSVMVGRELGLSEAALRDVEYAGLLHDLGQVSLDRPIPHGATVHTSALDQRRLAATGAALLQRTADLSRLSAMVAHQATPYWRTEQLGELPPASRILRVANAYDDLMQSAEHPARPRTALLRLRLSAGYDYDPQVISALARVLLRGGLISREDLTGLDL